MTQTQAQMTDAQAIEAIEDDRTIFQALCTERDRLTALLPNRIDRASVEHVRKLVDRYAAKLNAWHSLDCYCVILPSGAVLKCDGHSR